MAGALKPKSCSKCGAPVEPSHWKRGRRCKRCLSDQINEHNRLFPGSKRASSAKYKAAHADELRAAARLRHWRKHGLSLTLADYDCLLAQQDGRCAICGSEDPGGHGRFFHVDHDHDFRHVRGLLCSSCNRGLGLFTDSPKRLRAAAKYIETNRPQLKLMNGGR